MKWTMITEEEALPLLKLKTTKYLREKIRSNLIPRTYYNYNKEINRYFFRKEMITGN